MIAVYICSQGHRTPAVEVRRQFPVIPCPYRIAQRMQCGANARLKEVPSRQTH